MPGRIDQISCYSNNNTEFLEVFGTMAKLEQGTSSFKEPAGYEHYILRRAAGMRTRRIELGQCVYPAKR